MGKNSEPIQFIVTLEYLDKDWVIKEQNSGMMFCCRGYDRMFAFLKDSIARLLKKEQERIKNGDR